MTSQWGQHIRISVFGESHGPAIGVVMDGVPSGIQLDMDALSFQMERRAPGRQPWSTPRMEKDQYRILSGFYRGATTGTPLCAVMENQNTKSGDYSGYDVTPRPGTADYTGRIRYKGYNDIRGSGHFSGRLTAPLVFAGAVARQILSLKGVTVSAYIQSIAGIRDETPDIKSLSAEELNRLQLKVFPVFSDTSELSMKAAIERARREGDSVGGTVTVMMTGVPVGVGSPIFGALESKIASLVFSVPAVKGLSFGEGFQLAEMKGSEANDPYIIEKGNVSLKTNRNGGILGGITNGMPILFTVAVKPTPSVSKTQDTVNLDKMEATKVSVMGRHDPCIVPRVVPVLEACGALALLDAWMDIEKPGEDR